jgi:hypothetical protein
LRAQTSAGAVADVDLQRDLGERAAGCWVGFQEFEVKIYDKDVKLKLRNILQFGCPIQGTLYACSAAKYLTDE